MSMPQDFILSEKLTGRFAVVKLWPNLKVAEDECIARLKIAASALGLTCFEILQDGRLLEDPSRIIAKNEVDFVLHLHFDTPKLYDAFSFVALWNPIGLYHQWGFNRCSRNLLSHDDFVSCSSDPADHHISRLIRKSGNHLSPLFKIYHSLSDIIYPPTLGDYKLFYIGINWDVLTGGVSRHQELLKFLDHTGILRIYGPTVFQGVKVWEGYQSYVNEIPFDGISVINEINKVGIALVLSSEMHKQSQLMSNRLFESIAAGALVICDENPFARNFFGDTLLYIDTRCNVKEISDAIFNHVNWAKKNPSAALEMIGKAQKIFKDTFSLKKNLQDLYEGLTERKLKLHEVNYPKNASNIKVNVNFLMPVYSPAVLKSHIASIAAQDYTNFSPILVVDKVEAKKNYQHLQQAIAQSAIPIEIFEVDFFIYDAQQKNKGRYRLGEIITQILAHLSKENEAIIFVAPNEKLFSNHIRVLAGSLARNPNHGCSATAVMLKHNDSIVGNYETIDFRELEDAFPIGYGRFIFRVSMLLKDLNLALPYLDRKALAVLIGDSKICQEMPATIMIRTDFPFPADIWNEGQENELISSFCPSVFTVLDGFEIKLPVLFSDLEEARRARQNKKTSWIIFQLRELFKQGPIARINAMKKKFRKILDAIENLA